ncbi:MULTISPECIES: glycoside hydrolase family 43 protein [Chitinophagaceae]
MESVTGQLIKRVIVFCSCFLFLLLGVAQQISKVWNPDLGNGNYKNPVINADYSDPDAIRVGEDFYMVASSFDQVPGIPILHSKDLVNWELIGHALKRQLPDKHFSTVQHGNGVWAPAIRYHDKRFYIYYPDPDFGIYRIHADRIDGPWSEPKLIVSGKGLIDPCPLWDTDGKVYLVHGFAGSRAGIKSVLSIMQLNTAGDTAIDEGTIVFDGHEQDPTLEGPKLYKRNGYYYIFAPAGGVSTGWQLVLRSKRIYGPYERKVAMDEGASGINGPHQGAWVTTTTGEDWFLHFQDRGTYGRVVHLQPMKWDKDWPIIGEDRDGNGKGEPVRLYRKPNVGRANASVNPIESDEFDKMQLGVQWQWQANPKSTYAFTDAANGVLRLYTQEIPDAIKNLWFAPNVLTQKFPADSFSVCTKMRFSPNKKLCNEQAGAVILGKSYAALGLCSGKDGKVELRYSECLDADRGKSEVVIPLLSGLSISTVYLKIDVHSNALCRFAYSLDGTHFVYVNKKFQAIAGQWIGAKVGLFATRDSITNDAGYVDVDYFRITKISD